MNMQVFEYIVIGAAIFALILYRQLRTRAVRTERSSRVVVIIGAIGLVETVLYLRDHHVGGYGVAALVTSLLVAAALAAWRANTVRVWRSPGGDWLRKGGMATLGLWVLAMAAHIGIDAAAGKLAAGTSADGLAGLAGPSAMLFIAVSLGLQNVVLGRRVHRLAAHTGAAPAPVSHTDVAV